MGVASGAFVLALIGFIAAFVAYRRAELARATLQQQIGERGAVADFPAPQEMARLRALDWMLGGVAHDLNNALSVVLMNLDVMQQDAAVIQKHERRLEGMFDSMTGASSLVRHLLNFSHSRRPAPEIVSLAEAMPPLIELIQAAVGRDVAVRFEPAECGPCCSVVDQASFEVTVVHLALQLAQDMRRGGELIISLATKGSAPAVAAEQVVLTMTAIPGGKGSPDAPHALDLEMAERFAQNAQGSLTAARAGDGQRVMLELPGCSEITAV
jgi:signal transduction histidine kinase